jgi:hypothetical protein
MHVLLPSWRWVHRPAETAAGRLVAGYAGRVFVMREAERLAGLLVDLPVMAWTCARLFWLIRRRDRVLARAEDEFLTRVPGPAR